MMISMTNPELRTRLETQLTDPSILRDPFAAIVLLLLHEKSKPDSFWRPYFDILFCNKEQFFRVVTVP